VARRPTVGAPNLPDPFVITRTFGETSMHLDCLRAPTPGAALCKFGMALAALWPSAFASAQTAAPGASAASAASAAELTPAQRAKRDGDQVFHWILIHSDKPRKPAAAKDEKPAVAVTHVKPPARTAARADEPAPAASTATVTSSAASAASPRTAVAAPEATPATAIAAVPDATAASAAVKLATATMTTPAAPAAAAAVEDDAPESLKPVSQTEPKFPINLIRSLRAGQVQVKFTVLTDGSVTEPEVLSSSHPRLNPPALAAVAQWRFAPLRKPQRGVVELGFNNAD
jgi:TonB family protein